MARSNRVYLEPTPVPKDRADELLAGGDPDLIRETLVSLAFFEPDWRWVQAKCLHYATHSEWSVRALATTCIGHLARIHRKLDFDLVAPALRTLLEDDRTRPYAIDAIEDIQRFIPGKAGWTA